jgi:hypothetical protein
MIDRCHIEWKFCFALFSFRAEFRFVTPKLTQFHPISGGVMTEFVVDQFTPVWIVSKVFVISNSNDGFEGIAVLVRNMLKSFGYGFGFVSLVLGGAKDEPVDGE